MCGIAGQFFFQAETPLQVSLNAMAKVMESRGPDDEGFYRDKHIGLVHRRLSIRDLSSAGHCPMSNKDGSIQVVLNGEIYNWRELRKELEGEGCQFKSQSDTEVIVNGYEMWGEAIVSKLTGMFSLAVWDNSNRQLLLARDRLGEKPLYYSLGNEGLIFASSVDAIARITENKTANPIAIGCYLSHSFIPSKLTVWNEISVLSPAHMLRVTPGKDAEVWRYWELPRSKPLKMGFERAVNSTRDTIDKSVQLCLDADVPVGVFLSGGVDSSLVAALAAQYQPDLPAFSLGFQENSHSELPFSDKVAHHLGIPHHTLEIGVKEVISCLPHLVAEYGQPFGDASAVPTFLVSQFARKHVKVCLSGDGADEIFGGYWRMQSGVYAARYANHVPRYIRRKIIPGLASRMGAFGRRLTSMNDLSLMPAGQGYTNSLSWLNTLQEIAGPELQSALSVDMAELRVGSSHDRVEASVVQRVLLDDIETQLPDAYLTKVDVASMAASLEVRSPFLEKKVFEAAWLLPDRYKLHYGERKWLLKKIACKLVPKDVIYRKKMGFAMPLAKWFRKDLGDYMCSLMEHSIADAEGWIQASLVQKLLRDHRNGESHETRLWLVLWLELWFRFMQGPIPEQSR